MAHKIASSDKSVLRTRDGVGSEGVADQVRALEAKYDFPPFCFPLLCVAVLSGERSDCFNLNRLLIWVWRVQSILLNLWYTISHLEVADSCLSS